MTRIVERENRLPHLVSELNGSGLPVLFYGAGQYAGLIYDIFRNAGLHISDFVVTSLENNPSDFKGHKLSALQDTLEKYDKCNVLIAFGLKTSDGFKQIEENLMRSGKVANIYFYDGVHYQFHNEAGLEYSFIEKHEYELEQLYEKLADDRSRDILVAFINQRISGDTCYLRDLVTSDQYFPNIINLLDDEVFVDCGAYDGDTIDAFICKMGSKRIHRMYAFEPDTENYTKLKLRGFENMIAIQKGVYDKRTTLRFSGQGDTESSLADSGGCEVEVDTVDNVLQGKKVTYIKMDIEGSELAAIEGAVNTIITYRPKLAISAYHRKEDLITIPQKILSLVPDYKLYLRIHLPYSSESVLYATTGGGSILV
jgi:FkbM family methyltransferase